MDTDNVTARLTREISGALEAGDSTSVALHCDGFSQGLLDAGDERGAMSVLRLGIAHLRLAPPDHGQPFGVMEGAALRLYGELAQLLVPDAEAIEIADELVDVIRSGRAHPMDVAEAKSLRAEVVIQCDELEPAIAAAKQTIMDADGVCLHDLADRVVQITAHRLRADGFSERADLIERGTSSELPRSVPGHIHLWDIGVGLL